VSARTQERDRADPAGVSRSGSRPARLGPHCGARSTPGHGATACGGAVARRRAAAHPTVIYRRGMAPAGWFRHGGRPCCSPNSQRGWSFVTSTPAHRAGALVIYASGRDRLTGLGASGFRAQLLWRTR
jgi:hypothetical protein